jgi:hypothetical protein
MNDPNPENIVGQKRVTYAVEWQIQPSYLLAALVALVVAWKLLPNRSGSSMSTEPEESMGEEAAGYFEEIDVTDGGGGLIG